MCRIAFVGSPLASPAFARGARQAAGLVVNTAFDEFLTAALEEQELPSLVRPLKSPALADMKEICLC